MALWHGARDRAWSQSCGASAISLTRSRLLLLSRVPGYLYNDPCRPFHRFNDAFSYTGLAQRR